MSASSEAVREHCPELPADLVDGHFRRVPVSYFDRHDLEDIIQHLRLLAKVSPTQPFVIDVAAPAGGGTDLIVAGLDQPGLIACLTATLAFDGYSLADLNVAVYEKDEAATPAPELFVVQLTIRGPSDPPSDYAHRLSDRLAAAWPHLTARAFEQARDAATADAPTRPLPTQTEPGWLPEMFGNDFLRRERLAVGGMSEVYLAEQISLRRTVVLKVSRTRLDPGSAGLDRFTREAVTLARFQSPYIVPVLAAGTIPSSTGARAWFAMDYLPGGDLARRLREHGPATVEVGTRWLRQALTGLLDAHRYGFIHRDLKPHNLLLTADGNVKLADFGLFQPLSAPSEPQGAISGTPPYMSPEQASGGVLDGRSDLYSLGSTFFHLFAGRLPFPGDDAGAVMAQIASTNAPRLRDVAAHLPMPLDVILGRMMARDPLARYQDAKVALDDLASYESRNLLRSVDRVAEPDPESIELALTATHHEGTPTGG